jgi:cytoskeleton protein RodZ
MSDFAMTEPMHDAAGQPEQGMSQPSPGAQLAARRQQFGWTVEQVASQINLAPRQIEAIEADNYAALPGMAVARGFIRAYAKLLRIDAAPLMAQIGNAPSVAENTIPLRRTVAAASFTPHRPATRARRGGTGKLVVGVVVIALIGAGAYAAMRNGLGTALADRVAQHLPGSDRKSAVSVDTPDNAAPNSVVETPAAPALSESTSPASPAAVAPAVLAPQPPATAGAPMAPATALTPSASLDAASTATDKALVLNLREDSWVEIRRADNSTLVSRVMRAGSSERFDIAGPVTLVVGNARGVDVTYRGEPLSLKSGAKNNVARVRVQ